VWRSPDDGLYKKKLMRIICVWMDVITVDRVQRCDAVVEEMVRVVCGSEFYVSETSRY
jgi:hypothetical protein